MGSPNSDVNRSTIGRDAAIIAIRYRPDLRTVERIARNRGYAVSRAALARASAYQHGHAHKPNEGIVAQASHDIAEELSETFGYPLENADIEEVRHWFHLNHSDHRLNTASVDDPVWAADEAFARSIIAREARVRPFNQVLRASAYLHLWRNKTLPDQEREEARRRAVSLLETYISTALDDHYAGTLEEILGPENMEHPAMDPAGLVLSIALNLVILAHGAEDDQVWLAHLSDLQSKGLLSQVAVRGIFFSDPVSLSNLAESYWMLGDLDNSRSLIIVALELNSDLKGWLQEVGAKFYEPGFMEFSLSALSQGAD
jgi:tetratricopeptide (TPR) repeat protein